MQSILTRSNQAFLFVTYAADTTKGSEWLKSAMRSEERGRLNPAAYSVKYKKGPPDTKLRIMWGGL